jgi:hypothetical protein
MYGNTTVDFLVSRLFEFHFWLLLRASFMKINGFLLPVNMALGSSCSSFKLSWSVPFALLPRHLIMPCLALRE